MGTTWRKKFGLVAAVALLSAAGCSAAQPTAQIVVLTYPPASASVDAGTQASPEATATEAATPTAAPTPTPAPTQATSAAPTETPTPTPTPSATPTSPAATCTGSDTNRAFFVDSAAKLKFPVYCAVLPKGWYLKSATYQLTNGGYFEAVYTNKTKQVKLVEGNYCNTAPNCTLAGPITTGSLGGLSGTLYSTTYGFFLLDKQNPNPSYGLQATGLTQAETLSYGAALYKVPKS